MTNCRQTRGIARKRHTTITRYQEEKQSKATISLFPIEMIEKLESTQSNAQQNIEQVQNPTAINNQQRINNKQQQNYHLRTDSSQRRWWGGGGGAKMHFTGTKSSPYNLLLLKQMEHTAIRSTFIKHQWSLRPKFCLFSSGLSTLV